MRSNQRIARALCLTAVVFLASLAVALLLLAPSVAASPDVGAPAGPEVGASIWLRPPAGVIEADTEINVTVALSDVVDLYGMGLMLSFPADKLQVIDAKTGETGVQSTPGDCPAAVLPQGWVVQNSANNTTGVLAYAVTQFTPTLPVSGHCDVLHIQFQVVDGPTAQITFDDVTLADKEGTVIPVTLLHRELAIETEKLNFLPLIVR